MRIERALLDEAAAQGVLQQHQVVELWRFLCEREHEIPRFKPAHVLYYLGGMIAIGAMTLFMTLGWERFGGKGLLFISVGYAAIAVALTEWLLHRRHLALPAGIAATLAVVVVPMGVYGAQLAMGLWPAGQSAYRNYHAQIDWRWIFMELATLAAGAIALWRYRLPLLLLPLAVTLWYMSMDLVPLFLDGHSIHFYSARGRMISTAFGLLIIAAGFWIDLRTRRTKDFAFWLYVFGAIAFWSGLSSMNFNNEIGKLAYAAVNLLMIAIGAALTRRVFAVFGGLGFALYLAHLSHAAFLNSMLFPVALTAIGLGVVACGVGWQRHEERLRGWLSPLLPRALQDLVVHGAS
jgi:hypothetical protein